MAKNRGPDRSALTWERCHPAFPLDGGLRDVYVVGTDVNDWDRLLDLVRSSGWPCSYTADGVQDPIPESAQRAFDDGGRAKNLSFDLGSIQVNGHFFAPEEIELDLDPRQVQSQEALDRVLSFVEDLGGCLGKEVILTEENSQDQVWFRYEPASGAITFTTRREEPSQVTWQPWDEASVRAFVTGAAARLDEGEAARFETLRCDPYRVGWPRCRPLGGEALDDDSLWVLGSAGARVLLLDTVEEEFCVGQLETPHTLDAASYAMCGERLGWALAEFFDPGNERN